jgi:hypothetical protein
VESRPKRQHECKGEAVLRGRSRKREKDRKRNINMINVYIKQNNKKE